MELKVRVLFFEYVYYDLLFVDSLFYCCLNID